MIQMSHIVVLSQPEFVEREVCSVLSDSRPGLSLSRWLGSALRGIAR